MKEIPFQSFEAVNVEMAIPMKDQFSCYLNTSQVLGILMTTVYMLWKNTKKKMLD